MKPINNIHEPITGSSIDEIWIKLFNRSMTSTQDVLGPTLLAIENIHPDLISGRGQNLQDAIDTLLKSGKKPRIRETANIIFPNSTWRTKQWDIDQLSSWYVTSFMPHLRATAPAHLRNTYFERMINFSGSSEPSDHDNQLKFIISACKKKGAIHHFRQSGLQVCILDPKRDQSRNPRKNFPCLQQVGFSFLADGALGLSAFYPTQLIIERAYGNYLGLCQLGQFMAQQIGVSFKEFSCFVGSPRIGSGFSKRDLEPLLALTSAES